MTTATKATRRARQTKVVAHIPEGIRLVGTELRSTNLERDVRDQHLYSPYVGARALDVLDRITNAAADRKRTRAFSFTGPYGSGKSTLANLLDASLGHEPTRQSEAQDAVAVNSPGLAGRLTRVRNELAPQGFLGAVATADREPLARTVFRALQTAAERRWKKRPPKAIAQALAACAQRNVPSTESLVDAVSALCAEAPVLLIVDEFGKTLEHLAAEGDSSSAENDVYLLQVLAEKGAGRSGLPLFMLTLQHLAFSDYAARSSTVQSKEWAKVQGRFEDITFAPNLGDAVHLMRRRLDSSAVNAPGRKLIDKQAQAAATAWHTYGLNAVVDISPEMFADLYPLHPLTAIAAPLLAAQIGQHDRTLTGFLASDEPHTVRRSLDTLATDAPARASTLRLPQLYDYFFASGRTTLLASANAGRWLEVDSRLNEAHGLASEDQDILKTIGILNLIDVDGVLRATPAMIQFALHDPTDAQDAKRFDDLRLRLDELQTRSFVVHREYSDEYRIWQGTDVQIDERVKEIAARLEAPDVVKYFNEQLGSVLPAAVVAGGHSQRTGMLRYFLTAVSHRTDKLPGPEVVTDAADGLLVCHFGQLADRPLVNSPLPVLIGTSSKATTVLQTGITLVALQELLEDQTIDRTAINEINERIADLSHRIGSMLDEAFNPTSSESSWYLWESGDTSSEPTEPIKARSYASLVSKACDAVYPFTPHIRNEMVGRHQLTSIAARTRRELLTAMLQQSGYPVLGFDTNRYTPERAMYHGVVEYLGLHQAADAFSSSVHANGIFTHGISRPHEKQINASVHPVWEALEQALTDAKQPTPIVDIYHQLMAPPYGVKAGVVPILVVTALILRAEDVALFEDGNYCQRLTPDIIERLNVAYPDRFTVKATPIGRGQRRLVVENLASSLDVEDLTSPSARNPMLLAVTRALLERMMVLGPYARQTRRLSPEALALRYVLSQATDPDELVFALLPTAVGFKPIPPNAGKDEASADSLVGKLITALNELSGSGSALRQEVVATMGRAFRLPPNLGELRSGLTERLRGFANASLELNLQGFVSRVLNETLSDEDWLDPIVIRLTNKALGDWTDRDADGFPRRVDEMARALDRVSHLYDVHHTSQQDTAGARSESQQIETRLLTLTTPEGAEERTLIHVPTKSRKTADKLVVSVIRQAEKALGPDGARILLAALAERLAETDPDPAQLR